MNGLSRVAFDAADGVARLLILCSGCLADVRAKTLSSKMRCIVRDFGTGSGTCEFCHHEILDSVGAV